MTAAALRLLAHPILVGHQHAGTRRIEPVIRPAACMDRMNTATTQQGFADAGPGVQLFYRVEGSGSRTVVLLHGGPGFSHDYLADDLLPLSDARRVNAFLAEN
jgi:hypothetical protein